MTPSGEAEPVASASSGRTASVLRPLSCQLVGSYVKPPWLVHHERVFDFDCSGWRVGAEVLDAGRADAARLAIMEQERAGLDVLTDGESWRLAYNTHFYARLQGVDAQTLARRKPPEVDARGRIVASGRADELRRRHTEVPRIIGPIEWPGPMSIDELKFLKRHTDRPVKSTVIGPLSAATSMEDEHYRDPEAAAMALAAALNRECRALDDEGVDLIQLDEPAFHMRFSHAERYGLATLERTLDGVRAPTIVHVCHGYAYFASAKQATPVYARCLELLASCAAVAGISLEYEQPGHGPKLLRHCGDKHVLLGLLDLGPDAPVESLEHVADRLREALAVVPPTRLHAAPDCGMWHLPREVAFAKLRALAQGAAAVRRERGI